MTSAGDIVSPATRSRMMRAVGQRQTSAELTVAALLRRLSVRYRVNVASLPGSPDFANLSRGWAIFVHGCFWHGHRNCTKTKGGPDGRIPTANATFWGEKIARNRARDARKARTLRARGLRILTVWECELRHVAKLERRIAKFLIPTVAAAELRV